MTWIEFEHTTGKARINLDRTFRLTLSGSTINVYSSASDFVAYSFVSSADALRIFNLLGSIVDVIDLDSLTNQ